MLVPMSWLREFTPYAGTAQALGDTLTMRGLELEEIVNPFADIAGIRVGFVASCEPHPDSDHLHCCKVDLGDGALLDIVCGAPNVAQGQKVAVAPVGCRLPDGMMIKKAKLRGQPSCGMICSERELGLSDDHGGIMILPESAVVGQPLTDALYMDTEVLDISVTPNRADCLSILGMARETAAAFKLPLHLPELPLMEDTHLPPAEVPIQIDNPDLCWLYTGRLIKDIVVAPSPMRFRYRLLAAGVRAISNIVDITNYILLEVGQPLHAFDYNKLEGGKIIVRTARDGETLVTLDGRERKLDSHDLCICDEKKPVGLAGVMGGQNTEIDEQSKMVFLESAVFKPQSIRKTSRKLGLVSEASYRFERGIDQARTPWALDRAASLMASLGKGHVLRGCSIAEPRPFLPVKIDFHPAGASKILGADIPPDFQAAALESFGIPVEKRTMHDWVVTQPSWRPDLTREADIVEEVGRAWGLDTIQPVLPPIRRKLDDNLGGKSDFAFFAEVKNWGSGLGLNEVINYSFTGETDLNRLGLPAEKRVRIHNPLSEEQNVLRTCLAPGLLQDLRNNLAYDSQSLHLFEVANVFEEDAASATKTSETPMLGLLLYGLRHDTGWPHREDLSGYGDLQGLVINFLEFLHLRGQKFAVRQSHPYLLPCVEVSLNGECVGLLGRVKPEIAADYNALKDVWLAELNLRKLRALNEAALVKFSALPVYPAVRRDITVVAMSQLKVGQIMQKILDMKLPLLEGAMLIDDWQPRDSGERHLTFRLTFRHASRTLKDAEVDKEREKVAEFLCRELPVKV